MTEEKKGMDLLKASRTVAAGTDKLNYLKRSKELAGEYVGKVYADGWQAKKSGKGKICWVTVPFPSSLLYTFNIVVFQPELDGVSAGIMGEAVKWQLHCEHKGYSRDLCSYARVNLGRIFAGAGEAEGAMPPPDFLVTSRMNCTTYVHWWEMLARHYKIPLFVMDGPFCVGDKHAPMAKHHEEYWIKRSHELIAFLEEHTGEKFDMDRYKENCRYEREAQEIYDKLGKYTQRVPTPVNEFDLLFLIMPICNQRGKKLCVDFYKECMAEFQDRVDKGITAIQNERHRILFISNPPWYKIDLLPQWLAEEDSVIVTSMINRMFVDYSDIGDGSFENTLRGYYRQYINLNSEERIIWAEELIKDWKCDGVALMDNRGCKPIAFPMPEMATAIERKLKIPCLRFEGNMNDPRDFNDQQVRVQFENFVELLEQ